jgi:putative salt-induced outer membrane protein YdiY
MPFRSTTITLAFAIILPLHVATAQDDKKPPASEFNADAGFVNVSGNTSITTLNVGERWIRRFRLWEFRHDFGTVYGKTDGKESSNLWRTSVRGDYTLNSNWALYALTAFDRNRFAGIKSRFAEGVGLAAHLLATDVNQLNLEGGFQVTQQKNLDGTNENFKSLRGATSWKRVFSKNAYFLQSLEFLPNLDDSKDLRINSETAVVAPLSSHVGLKFSYVVRYDNLPALNEEGTERLRKADKIFSSGVQVSF